MRKFLFTLSSSVLIHCFVFSQSVGDSINFKVLLFEHFIDGTVLLKNGQSEQVPLNYNMDKQNIVFIKDDKYLIISDVTLVDTVYIQDKKFITDGNVFYELISPGSVLSLFVTYSAKIRPIVATVEKTGFERKSSAEVSNAVSDVYTGRTFKGKYTVDVIRHYWVSKNKMTFYKANSEKQFMRAFPSKFSETIRDYIRVNAIRFRDNNELIALVKYCNEKMK
ncbi:MAG TPA: hypothetical protein VJU78_06535 [Chitinophagaceae bacterium]|nr:hypothetical protein [Chitinophagaceae bacterium]